MPDDGDSFYASLGVVCAIAAHIPLQPSGAGPAALRALCCDYLEAHLDPNGGAFRDAIAIILSNASPTACGVDLDFPPGLSADQLAPAYIAANRFPGVYADSNIMLSVAAGVLRRPTWVLEWNEQRGGCPPPGVAGWQHRRPRPPLPPPAAAVRLRLRPPAAPPPGTKSISAHSPHYWPPQR